MTSNFDKLSRHSKESQIVESKPLVVNDTDYFKDDYPEEEFLADLKAADPTKVNSNPDAPV